MKRFLKAKRWWMKRTHEKGFTLAEILVVVAITAMTVGVLTSAFIVYQQTAAKATVEQSLQQISNVIINKIIKGSSEPGGTFRLSEAVSYQIVTTSELHFVGTDGIERRYYLNPAGTSLLYNHPTAKGTVDEVIYTAPAGNTLALRFWVLAGTPYTNVTLGIDVGLSQNVSGRTVSGSTTTMINIRNHPV